MPKDPCPIFSRTSKWSDVSIAISSEIVGLFDQLLFFDYVVWVNKVLNLIRVFGICTNDDPREPGF